MLRHIKLLLIYVDVNKNAFYNSEKNLPSNLCKFETKHFPFLFRRNIKY